MPPTVINLTDKLDQFTDHWSPKLLGHVNDSAVKLVKLQGDFVWHHHEHEDELFLVLHGVLTIQFRDGDLTLNPGELVIIPHGVEHCPRADEEVHVLLFEPATTLNTGNVQSDRTVATLDEL